MEKGSTEGKYESGQGSDPTLGAAFVAFYIGLLCISSTKDKDIILHRRVIVLNVPSCKQSGSFIAIFAY